jgi:hypothetical protein
MSNAESRATETVAERDLSLPAFLAHRARHATDARLAVDAGAGFVVAVIVVLGGLAVAFGRIIS